MKLEEVKDQIREIETKFVHLDDCLDWEEKQNKINSLQKESEDPNLWNDSVEAGNILKKLEELKKEKQEWQKLKNDIENIKQLTEEEALGQDEIEIISEELQKAAFKLDKFEKKTLFKDKYDENNAILEIHAGAGGADAQDWSEMLLRMYLRFCEKFGFKTEIITKTEGSEAGIKNAVLEIKGGNAFGYLKGEKGVHRLVRQSPFNSDALRQTSFAAVEVWPVLEKNDQFEIQLKDLRIDTFRSSGAGGQHVNTTDSAVRITHLPTNTVVSCQSERSQQKNREHAMKILKAKLFQYFDEKEKEKEKELKGEKKSAEWGNQIRSYVFHPYKMVKDHRTGLETSEIENVMSGEIEFFLDGCLKFMANKK
ncbi:MAG: peptide chain release factor 2 [Candidatus Moraniibacteriota bacterium]